MGRKRMAVLVGCNYPNTDQELRGCINDALAMRQVLINRFGFKEHDIELQTDDSRSKVMPTGANIKNALRRMVDRAREGDVIFFHFSGHGTLLPSLKPDEPDRIDEAIVPCDLNLITDVDFREIIDGLRCRASFTILSDSCHSGCLIDQAKEQIGPSTTPRGRPTTLRRRSKYIPYEDILEKLKQMADIDTSDLGTLMRELFDGEASLSFRLNFSFNFNFNFNFNFQMQLQVLRADNGILLSGCQSNETSCDVMPDGGKAYGAFTNAVQQVLKANSKRVSNRELVMMCRKKLQDEGYSTQHPCLYCSDKNADVAFLLQP